jgi:hypothetical protein
MTCLDISTFAQFIVVEGDCILCTVLPDMMTDLKSSLFDTPNPGLLRPKWRFYESIVVRPNNESPYVINVHHDADNDPHNFELDHFKTMILTELYLIFFIRYPKYYKNATQLIKDPVVLGNVQRTFRIRMASFEILEDIRETLSGGRPLYDTDALSVVDYHLREEFLYALYSFSKRCSPPNVQALDNLRARARQLYEHPERSVHKDFLADVQSCDAMSDAYEILEFIRTMLSGQPLYDTDALLAVYDQLREEFLCALYVFSMPGSVPNVQALANLRDRALQLYEHPDFLADVQSCDAMNDLRDQQIPVAQKRTRRTRRTRMGRKGLPDVMIVNEVQYERKVHQ